jgi:putative transposase
MAVMAAEGLFVQLAARVLNVSVSGYYECKTRAPSRAEAKSELWV